MTPFRNMGHWWPQFFDHLFPSAESLGIYLEPAGLTLVQVKQRLTSLQINNVLRLPWPEQGLETLAPVVQETGDLWGLSDCPVCLAVSRELGFIREVTFPRTVAENLSQVVAYEMDRFLPLSPEALCYDFQVLESSATEIKVLIMALPRDLVDESMRLLAEIDLDPVSLEHEINAARNAFGFLAKGLSSPWLLCQTRSNGYDLALVRGKAFQSFKVVKAEKGSTNHAPLAEELEKFKDETEGQGTIGLFGPEARSLQADPLLVRSSLSVATLEGLGLEGLPAQDTPSGVLPALGAALRGVRRIQNGGNLLPAEARRPHRHSDVLLNRVLWVSTIVLVFLWLGSALLHPRIALYLVERQLANIAPEAEKVEQEWKRVRELAQKLNEFQKQQQQYPNKLTILQSLTKILPKHTWLYELSVNQRNLEISGESQSAAELIPLLEQSGWLVHTEFASPIITNAQKNETFKIKSEVKSLESGF